MKHIQAGELTQLITMEGFSNTFEDLRISKTIENTTFKGTTFYNCHFFNFIGKGVKFVQCKFKKCYFVNTQFTNTQFTNTQIQECDLLNTEITQSFIEASKVNNCFAQQLMFNQTSIANTKLVGNFLVSSTFNKTKILSSTFELSTLDSSKFSSCTLKNVTLNACNMRGNIMKECTIENSFFNHINFADVHCSKISESFIPKQKTEILQNKITNTKFVNILPRVINKAFKKLQQNEKPPKNINNQKILEAIQGFFSKYFSFGKISYNSLLQYNQKKQKKQLNKTSKSIYYILCIVTCVLQFFVTFAMYIIFKEFFANIEQVVYKSLPNLVELSFISLLFTVEIHRFGFYFSLLYFALSALLLCVNIICIKKTHSTFLILLNRIYCIETIITLLWLWYGNVMLQSRFITFFNIVFVLYFFVMAVQAFKLHTKKT